MLCASALIAGLACLHNFTIDLRETQDGCCLLLRIIAAIFLFMVEIMASFLLMLLATPLFCVGLIPWGCSGFVMNQPEAWFSCLIALTLFGGKLFVFGLIALGLNCARRSLMDQRITN